jgi:predicted DNA-binding transcriptional regulator YafY
MEILQAAGIDVHSERGHQQRYWLGSRSFSLPELRLLADAVQSSRFITDSKSSSLIQKLVSLTSEPNADKLRRTIHITGKAKTDNEKGYLITEAISEAIDQGRKISFYYLDYNGYKKTIRRNDGKPYTVSPYDLIWDGDYYYMTGFCDERGEVRTFRVDHIEKQPTLLESPAVPRPADYRVERYSQEVFRMFATQDTETVTLRCTNDVMRVLIDKFGKTVKTKPINDKEFLAEVTVCPGPTFFRWVFGWDGRIIILNPSEIREEYHRMVSLEVLRYTQLSK